jgi:hypothetical protein
MPETSDPPPLVLSSFSWSSVGKAAVVGGLVAGGVSIIASLIFAICRRPPNRGLIAAASFVAVAATSWNGSQLYDSWFTHAKVADPNAPLSFEKIKSKGFQFYAILPAPFSLSRKLLRQKMWMTALLYMQGDHAYLISYGKMPSMPDIWAMAHPESPNVPAGAILTYDVQKGLDGMMNTETAGMHAKVTETTDITVAGCPAREVRGELADGKHVFKERLVIGYNNLYMVQTIGTPEWVNSEESTRFLESFYVGEAPPTETTAANTQRSFESSKPDPATASKLNPPEPHDYFQDGFKAGNTIGHYLVPILGAVGIWWLIMKRRR